MYNNFFNTISLKRLSLLTGAAIALSSFTAQAMDPDNFETTVTALRAANIAGNLVIDEKTGRQFKITSLSDSTMGYGTYPEDTTAMAYKDTTPPHWRAFAYSDGFSDPTDPMLGGISTLAVYLEEVKSSEGETPARN